jgi:processive 1,2-diacylglycerol beta-glucosyltransferase
MVDEAEASAGSSGRGAAEAGPAPTEEILILSAGYGAGHNQAAAAVAEAVEVLSPKTAVRVVDYLRFFPLGLAPATVGIYRGLTKWAPTAYGGLYRLTSVMAHLRLWQLVEYGVGRERLATALRDRPPAVILCTHPLPLGVLGELRRRGAPSVPLAGVMTDFVGHDEWVKPFVDRYYAPTETMARYLAQGGVPAAKLVVTGIPVRRPFWTPTPPDAARRRLGFAPDVPVVLFLTSALGTLGRVPAAVRALLALPLPFRLVVVTGGDRGLYQKLAAWGIDPGRLTVLGFEERVAELMAAADVVVTKGGAITLSEALALARPVVVWRPVPGQEAGNARWLARRGACRIAGDARVLAETVADLLTHAEERESLAAGARALGRPRAALAVAEDLLALVRRSRRGRPDGHNPAN